METVGLWRIFGIEHHDADVSSRSSVSNAVTVRVTQDMKFLRQYAYLYIPGG